MIYAGFWRRFAALFIDGCVMLVIYMLLMIVPFFPQILAMLIAGFYHAAFETSPLRATPGKALMKIAVIKSNGSKLTIKDSIIRHAISLLSGSILCLGYFISFFNDKRQTFHDFVADTVVVEEVFADGNYFKIFIDQAKIIFGSDSHPIDSDNSKVSQSLEDLYNLHQKGILTDEEYRIKKEEYLKKL